MNYIKKIYSGRINRKNYFLGLLFFFFCLFIVMIATSLALSSSETSGFLIGLAVFIFWFYILSLHVRRLHDFGQSGWMVFIFIVPLVNLIFLIQLLSTKSNDGINKYGVSPSMSENFLDVIFNKNYKGILNKTIDDNKKQYCANCGEGIDSNSKFCEKCGIKL